MSRNNEDEQRTWTQLSLTTNINVVMRSSHTAMGALMPAMPTAPAPGHPTPPITTLAPTQTSAPYPVYRLPSQPMHVRYPATTSQQAVQVVQQSQPWAPRPPQPWPPNHPQTRRSSNHPQLWTSAGLPVEFDPSRPPPPTPYQRPSSSGLRAGPSNLVSRVEKRSSHLSCVNSHLRPALVRPAQGVALPGEDYHSEYRRKLEQCQREYLLLRAMLGAEVTDLAEQQLKNAESSASQTPSRPSTLFDDSPSPSGSQTGSARTQTELILAELIKQALINAVAEPRGAAAPTGGPAPTLPSTARSTHDINMRVAGAAAAAPGEPSAQPPLPAQPPPPPPAPHTAPPPPPPPQPWRPAPGPHGYQ